MVQGHGSIPRRTGGRRFGPRTTALTASGFALLIALIIGWFAISNSAETRRLIAEGQLAEGTFEGQQSRSSGGKTCFESVIAYKVAGQTYHVSGTCHGTNGVQPLDIPEIVALPRLGPERTDQVVYRPSNPSVAQLRSEITLDLVPYYGTGGMFLVIGLVFGFVGLVLLKPRTRKT